MEEGTFGAAFMARTVDTSRLRFFGAAWGQVTSPASASGSPKLQRQLRALRDLAGAFVTLLDRNSPSEQVDERLIVGERQRLEAKQDGAGVLAVGCPLALPDRREVEAELPGRIGFAGVLVGVVAPRGTARRGLPWCRSRPFKLWIRAGRYFPKRE